jgi:hypothetical protein
MTIVLSSSMTGKRRHLQFERAAGNCSARFPDPQQINLSKSNAMLSKSVFVLTAFPSQQTQLAALPASTRNHRPQTHPNKAHLQPERLQLRSW